MGFLLVKARKVVALYNHVTPRHLLSGWIHFSLPIFRPNYVARGLVFRIPAIQKKDYLHRFQCTRFLFSHTSTDSVLCPLHNTITRRLVFPQHDSKPFILTSSLLLNVPSSWRKFTSAHNTQSTFIRTMDAQNSRMGTIFTTKFSSTIPGVAVEDCIDVSHS